jgi:hypothetical protein
MIDTCAGASVFPKNFDKRAVKDDTVPKTALITATSRAVKMAGGKRSTYTLRNGSSIAVKYSEANVSFPIVSVGEATVQGSWFVFGPGGQAMISSEAGAELEKLVTGPAAVQLQKSRGVYWLPCTASDKQDGVHAPPRADRKEAGDNEAPLAAMPLKAGSASSASHAEMDESEETRNPDDHHKRLADADGAGDADWAMDYFILTRAEEPYKMKVVLNCLDMQSGATFARWSTRAPTRTHWPWSRRA